MSHTSLCRVRNHTQSWSTAKLLLFLLWHPFLFFSLSSWQMRCNTENNGNHWNWFSALHLLTSCSIDSYLKTEIRSYPFKAESNNLGSDAKPKPGSPLWGRRWSCFGRGWWSCWLPCEKYQNSCNMRLEAIAAMQRHSALVSPSLSKLQQRH